MIDDLVVTYNLDSSTCIDIIRNKNPKPRMRFEQALVHGHSVVISTIVLHELAYGAEKSNDPKSSHDLLKAFLIGVDVLDFSRSDAMSAAAIRNDLSTKGLIIGAYDSLISGQALIRSHVMVTANSKHFARVIGLRVANWNSAP